jgi:phage-related protein
MSNNVNGLLVSSLPTISKPEMRTKTTTVDGRDGDIAEFLGFSAYDRTFTIGLYGPYDIDEVVKFFLNQETTNEFVFSNEPDKKYIGYISEAIDFEKLMKFKTASVTVHVQPFKFSSWERSKSFELNYHNPSNTIELFNNGNIYSRPDILITAGTEGNALIKLWNGLMYHDIIARFDEEGDSLLINPTTYSAQYVSGLNISNGNRRITGDYDDIKLQTGLNSVYISGVASEIEFINYSRWI